MHLEDDNLSNLNNDIANPEVVSDEMADAIEKEMISAKQKRETAENDARIAYNNNIHEIPDVIKEGGKPGDVLLVRLYKFHYDKDKEGAVIVPKFKIKTSDSGRQTARLDDFVYQSRGVILKIGGAVDLDKWKTDKGETLKIGDTVWINQRGINASNQFLSERGTPVVEFTGMLEVSPAHIQLVEKTK